MSVTSVFIAGVGGQGTLLASRLLGAAMIQEGMDVKVSEVHGMSQRGGSVVTHVRYGTKVFSPLIEEGEADVLLAFEQLEAARFLPYLKKEGLLIVNTQQIDPMSVITGQTTYPENLIQQIRALGVRVLAIDALALAQQAGSSKAVNVVMIGAMAKEMHFDPELWKDIIRKNVPQKFLPVNEKAFDLGYAATTQDAVS